jgi:hypothetical protein
MDGTHAQEDLLAKFEELYEELQQGGRVTSPHMEQIYDQLIGTTLMWPAPQPFLSEKGYFL